MTLSSSCFQYRALFESRRDAAHRDKQVVALKLELEVGERSVDVCLPPQTPYSLYFLSPWKQKAAKEVKSCRERKEKAAAGEKKGCDNV